MRLGRKVLAVGLGVGFAANLPAGEETLGFQWLGARAGTLFFAPSKNTGNTLVLGLQGGQVFKWGQYGFSVEGFQYRSRHALLSGVKLRSEGISATFLSGAPTGSLWPYVGLGLGTLRLPEVDPLTLATATTRTTEAHLALGFLDRPREGWVWGLEGRSLFRFPVKSLHEIQATLFVGFSWGAGAPASAPPRPAPHQVAVAPLPAATTAPEPAPAPRAAPSPEPALPMAGGLVITAADVPAFASMAAPVPAAATDVPALSLTTAHPVASAPAPAAVGRLEALRRGDIPLALDLSRAYIETLPAHHWTLRIEAARLNVTLKNAAWAFPGTPDLFIAPLQLRDGKSMNQLFLGDYGTRVEAERALRTVPSYFQKDRLRPFSIQVSDIPARACPMTRPVPKPRPATTPAPKGIPVRPMSSCTRCH